MRVKLKIQSIKVPKELKTKKRKITHDLQLLKQQKSSENSLKKLTLHFSKFVIIITL